MSLIELCTRLARAPQIRIRTQIRISERISYGKQVINQLFQAEVEQPGLPGEHDLNEASDTRKNNEPKACRIHR